MFVFRAAPSVPEDDAEMMNAMAELEAEVSAESETKSPAKRARQGEEDNSTAMQSPAKKARVEEGTLPSEASEAPAIIPVAAVPALEQPLPMAE